MLLKKTLGVVALAGAALFGLAAAPRAETILFVGNSFTYGAYSPVWKYRAGTVTDLNNEGVGGVPALFKLFTQEAGLDARGYRLQFQKLLARPLLLVAMVLVAASFSLRFFRFGGVAKTLAGGVAAGFVLYIATEISSDLGGSGAISPLLAAWSPAVVGSMLGTLSLLHSEDG